MPLLSAAERSIAEAVAGIPITNPFLPERLDHERRALGKLYVERGRFVHFDANASVREMFPNTPNLGKRSEEILDRMRRALEQGQSASQSELLIYERLAFFVLFYRYVSLSATSMTIRQYTEQAEKRIAENYDSYRKAFRSLFKLPGRRLPWEPDPDVMFAVLFQAERAFISIFTFIVGHSLPAARLRAAVWDSIFTCDIRRYAQALHGLLGNVTTLITGPSGTGKELIARAIAYSGFIPFDPAKRQFVAEYTRCFHGLNLSALPSTLIESELFGHVKGAFSGAMRDHYGHLDEKVCSAWGTVFLDEIGDVDEQIQVKLLRVLENREFQRVGEVTLRPFKGKIVAATNRDLEEEMATGGFREDFYYRLCSDRILTPSLRQQLEESPGELTGFVRYLSGRLLSGFPEEAEKLTAQVVPWIETNLGPEYTWPGNIRELEQCVRSIMIRGSYTPTRRKENAASGFLADVAAGRLKREALLEGYSSLVYKKTGSYRKAAKVLDTDWRTVQRFVKQATARRR